jgi:hypothetical protein
VPKPEISAPGGFVAAAMSQDADPRTSPGGLFDAAGCPDNSPCYVVDETHAITAGSSMSAPHVTGAVALLFELDLQKHKVSTLTQARVTDVLQAGARYPKGRVRELQLGPGALDIEGARQAFLADEDAEFEPSLDKSWYVLSSGYARPDPSWPVWGTVELRRADGGVASGIGGTELELSVKGGIVVQPIARVRQGLFRFAVAGARGTGGKKIWVDVTYGGVSIGPPRELPIGEDAWRSNGIMDATSGGCAWPAAEQRKTAASAWPLGIAFAGVFAGVFRRRRRAS